MWRRQLIKTDSLQTHDNNKMSGVDNNNISYQPRDNNLTREDKITPNMPYKVTMLAASTKTAGGYKMCALGKSDISSNTKSARCYAICV